MTNELRPAFYCLEPGSWRDYYNLFHVNYSVWFLGYVVLGAALAPGMRWALLGWTLLAFALGMVISAHYLDELHGRPLKTRIPSPALWGIAGVSLVGAALIGVLVGVRETLWVIPLIVFGVFITFAYNLEWGFFHDDIWFGIAWGAFPVLTGYIAQSHTLTWSAVLVAIFALLYSMAQRKLSLHARFFRRKEVSFTATYFHSPISKESIIKPAELALKYMTWAVVSAATGLLLIRC